jgi:glycosyltransferase involved in cell wall biosynthesis
MALHRVDERPIPSDSHEIRLFMTVRNEVRRLLFAFDYYCQKGVDRFFIVDDGSTDGTREFLLARRTVHVFVSDCSYSSANYGVSWLTSLLEEFGSQQWCVIVDADEMFTYPHCEDLTMRDLCSYMESENASALYSVLLDMYSESAFGDCRYVSGANPLSVCPWFETETIRCVGRRPAEFGGALSHFGGMRKRMFDVDACLDKISFMKFDPRFRIGPGMHRVAWVRLSKIQGAVLHFKFLEDFEGRATLEAKREEHWNNAVEYKLYSAAIRDGRKLRAHSSVSRFYHNSGDLLRYGIMRSTVEFDNAVARTR